MRDRSLARTVSLRAVRAIVLGAMVSPGAAASAQQGRTPPLVTSLVRADGSLEQLPVRSGFSLFSSGDVAGTSLKLQGNFRWAQFNAGGLCSFGNFSGDLFNSSCGSYPGLGGIGAINALWGVPPSAYAKILAAWPGVAQMQQPRGYSTPWRMSFINPRVLRIGPSDGQMGVLFSGVTAQTGADCRDMSGVQGAGIPTGLPLTAASNCQATWGPGGFQGMRAVPDSAWLNLFRANPTAFRWDDWKIPASALGNSPFIGDLTTYGAFSDFGTDIYAMYGVVTPHGDPAQPPRERGFPVGIEVRYDAFKFDRQSLRDGVFVRWIVVNKSQSVWGTGIDYDSLYMGVDPGYIRPSGNVYNDPAHGVQVEASGGLSGRCSPGLYPRRALPGINETCAAALGGFRVVMVLRSPIGDLRNKLFSDPTSPYYFPGHQKADDTITFNHWRNGGFGQQEAFSWRRNDRALFGLMSGNETLWLDGRSYTEFSATQIWNLFRYEFSDGSQSLANMRYSRSVPGNWGGSWDYNDDGVQDTLIMPECGSLGCAKLWSDTIPGGFGTSKPGELANYLGVGPFSLKAGDTTEFVWFLGGVLDTTAYAKLVRNVTDAYLANYSTLLPYAPPTLAASDVQITVASADSARQTSHVRLQLRMPPRQADTYMSRVVLSRLQAGDPVAVELQRLNPGLVQKVQARAQQNLARVLVFKSCDSGHSWTDATGVCDSALTARTQTVGGGTAGLGWQAFRTIAADSITGNLATHVVTDEVPPGHEYLYSFVTQTRGLADIPVVYQETVDASGTVTSRKIGTLWDAIGTDVDTVTSPFMAIGPTTVAVYAPVSLPAGTIVARVDTATVQGLATNRVTSIPRSAYIDGAFRMRFGNRFILSRVVDTATSATTTILIRQATYPRAATAPAGVVTQTFVAAADTFVSNHGISYSSASASSCPACQLQTAPRTTTGTVQTFIDTIPEAGYVIAKGPGGTEPLYLAVGNTATAFGAVSNNSGIAQSTSDFEGSRWYPGFTATVTTETALPGTRKVGSHSIVVIRAPGDTLADTVASAGVGYGLPNGGTLLTGLRNSRGGLYRVSWLGDAFGPQAPFAFGTAAQMQPVLDASLSARPVVGYTETAANYRAAIIASTAPGDGSVVVGSRTLVRVSVPFGVIGPNGQPAKLVMLTRHVPGNALDSIAKNSRLFGTNGDTTRLTISPDVWVPGDSVWVFENLVVDSTVVVGGQTVTIVRDSSINGRVQRLPIQVTRELLAMKLVLQCASNTTPSRITCNPIRAGGLGASKYQPFQNGWDQLLNFNRLFDQNSEVALTATPTQATARPLSKADMSAIRVVPNPYIVQSAFDQPGSNGAATARLLFTNVPNEGTLRIYTVSGQLVQQLSWTAGDLQAAGDNSPHGDLPYDLRTRDGHELVSGLYLYVLTPRGPNANRAVARGKFVIIR